MKELIEELKNEDYAAPMIENNTILGYRIKIISRGEQLFYHDKLTNRAVIIEIQIRNGSIFKDSIKKWDDGKPINEEEKEIIYDRLSKYFINYQKVAPIIR